MTGVVHHHWATEDGQWLGKATGTVEEIVPTGYQWRIRLGDEWFTTKVLSVAGKMVTTDLVGQTVTVYFDYARSPATRRVFEIKSDLYPTIPGIEWS